MPNLRKAFLLASTPLSILRIVPVAALAAAGSGKAR